jgi:hypothetical protein
MAEFDHRNLTRREAAILRQLAQAYLEELRQRLQGLSLATPAEPGQRERPYVRCRRAIETISGAIAKLRRMETR